MSIDVSETTARRGGPSHGRIKLIAISAGGFFLLVVAGTWNVTYMFSMAAVLLALPVVSLAVARLWAWGISGEREELAPMLEGEQRDVTVSLRQRVFAGLALEILERLPASVESLPAMPVPSEVNETSVDTTFALRALRRGVHRVGPLSVVVHDPLGITSVRKTLAPEYELVVYPRPLNLPSWGPSAAGAANTASGESGCDVKGSGTDFHGIRRYAQGDELRRVHWRSAARARELMVVEFQETLTSNDVLIAVDARGRFAAKNGVDVTLDYEARAAAFVAENALENGGRVTMVFGGKNKRVVAHSAADRCVVLDALARIEADSEASIANALLGEVSGIDPETTVVVISSTVEEDLRAVARGLLERGIAVAQVYVDPESFGISGLGGQAHGLDARIPLWRVTQGES